MSKSARLCIRLLILNVKKCMCEGVIITTALYGAEAWGMEHEKC